MRDLKECPICLEKFCPVNSVDENGQWDGSSKQNCSCPIWLYDRAEQAEARADRHNDARYMLEQECMKLTRENHELKAEVERLKEIVFNHAICPDCGDDIFSLKRHICSDPTTKEAIGGYQPRRTEQPITKNPPMEM